MFIPSFKILAIIFPEITVTQKKILQSYVITDYGQTKSSIAPLFQSGAINDTTLAPIYFFVDVVGWLFWAERPFGTVFQSISGRLRERGRKKIEMIDERKNVQTAPTRTNCKHSRPSPHSNSN